MKLFNPNISYFAETNHRNTNVPFGIKQQDRMLGMYILGKTGTGKTNLMESLIYQDIKYFRGLCLIDITGDISNKLKKNLPDYRKRDLVLLDTTNTNMEWGYNPLRKVAPKHRHLIASHIIETFQKIWGSQAWGVRIEYILRNSILTLLDQEEATFADIPKLLTIHEYRETCVKNVLSAQLRDFWSNEYPSYSKSDIMPVLNKVGSFITNPILRKILIENKNQLSIPSIMNESKILLVNVSKGSIGTDASYLLGSLILGAISGAGFYRVHTNEEIRKPFFVYLDEFQNFTTQTLATMFSELRKFKIGFVIAHQYLNQVKPSILDAVLGNIGTIITFRISYQDAVTISREFYPTFIADDIINLENYHIYLKLMIDGRPSRPFSALTINSLKLIKR